ncbi:MAG: 50S ribosomal protein L23 [Planctomycetota bacterium]
MEWDPYRIVKRPLVTERGMDMVHAHRAYPFQVELRSNKAEIKRAVEVIFKVKVKKVRTMVVAGKPRRLKARSGYTSTWKKAIVTLAEGNSIELM